MVDVPMEKIGQGSGSQSTVRQIGSALGIAVLGTVLFTSSQLAIENRINELAFVQEMDDATAENFASSISEPVVDSAGSAIPALEAGLVAGRVAPADAKAVVEAAGEGFTDGVKATGWAAAFFLLLGLASTFNLGSRKKKSTPTV